MTNMMRNKYIHQHLQQNQQQNGDPPQHHQRSKSFLPMLCSSSSTKQVKLSHRRCASSSSSASSSLTEDPSSPKVGCMGQVKRNNKVGGLPSIINFSSNNINTTTTTTHAIKCHQHEQPNYTSNSIVKYYKLKRLFSSKSLTGSPTSVIAAARTTSGSVSHRGKGARNNNVGSLVITHSRGRLTTGGGGDQHHKQHHGAVLCRPNKVHDRNSSSSVCSKKNNSDVDKCTLVNLVEMDPPLPVVKKTVQLQQQQDSILWKRRSGGVPLKSLQVQVTHQNLSLNTASTV